MDRWTTHMISTSTRINVVRLPHHIPFVSTVTWWVTSRESFKKINWQILLLRNHNFLHPYLDACRTKFVNLFGNLRVGDAGVQVDGSLNHHSGFRNQRTLLEILILKAIYFLPCITKILIIKTFCFYQAVSHNLKYFLYYTI